MTRFAIYARVSTLDRQNQNSTDDQVDRCHRLVEGEGFTDDENQIDIDDATALVEQRRRINRIKRDKHMSFKEHTPYKTVEVTRTVPVADRGTLVEYLNQRLEDWLNGPKPDGTARDAVLGSKALDLIEGCGFTLTPPVLEFKQR